MSNTENVNCETSNEGCTQNGGCGCHHDATQTVTKEQGGQFIDEGGMMFARNMEDAALEGTGEAQLVERELGAVNALQVNMERSGAEYIHAQKSFLTNSGARQISSESSRLTNSGVLTLEAESAEFKQSSAVIAKVGKLTVSDGNVLFSTSESAHFEGEAAPVMMQAREVQANGDIKAFAILGGDIKAGGNVTTTVSPVGAAAFGAALGAVLLLIGRLFGKK